MNRETTRNAMTQKTITPDRARRLYRILLIAGITGTALYMAARCVAGADSILAHWLYDASCLTAISLTFMRAFYWKGRLEEMTARQMP